MSEPIKVFCRKCKAKLDVSDLEPFSYFECPECGAKLRAPKRFDRYLLEKICGSGGASVVYRALDPQLIRRVAIKILRPREEDGELESIFRRELQIVGKLSHPGIIPVYNCGVYEKSPFLVMRYMENGDMEHHMKSGTLPPDPQLLGNLADIACALEFIHRNGAVHHDVKPSNIMLTADNDAKIGDFDLADERADGDFATQCTGWGSPGYVSPERLYGGGEDFRGDIFSFGVTIYELLSGKLPFGVHGEPAELYQRRQQPFESLTALLGNRMDPVLPELVNSMLSFDPEQRPQYPEIIRELRSASRRLAAPKQLHITPSQA